MAKKDAENTKRADGYISKYMEILKIDGEPPNLKLLDNPSADWYARTRLRVIRHDDGKNEIDPTLELQKKTLLDEKLLERVIAHEMVHVRNRLAAVDVVTDPVLTKNEKTRSVRDLAGHGPVFQKGAARINAIMGSGFVTEYALGEEEEEPEAIRQYERRSASRRKLILVLGVGALGFLGAALLRRKRGPSPSMPTMPRRPSLPVEATNERGHYGKK